MVQPCDRLETGRVNTFYLLGSILHSSPGHLLCCKHHTAVFLTKYGSFSIFQSYDLVSTDPRAGKTMICVDGWSASVIVVRLRSLVLGLMCL